MTAKILKLNKTTDEDLLAVARRDAAIRAIYRVGNILREDLAKAKKKWKVAEAKAIDAYREHLRDEDRRRLEADVEAAFAEDIISRDDVDMFTEIAEHYFAACSKLAEYVQLAQTAKEDKDDRANRIASFDDAEAELKSIKADKDGGQLQLLGGDLAPTEWASKETKAVAYAALRHLEEARHPLDAYQAALLAELATDGLDAMDLGLDISEAVEADGEYPDEDNDAADEIDIDGILD